MFNDNKNKNHFDQIYFVYIFRVLRNILISLKKRILLLPIVEEIVG